MVKKSQTKEPTMFPTSPISQAELEELRARVTRLEAENADLRQRIAGMIEAAKESR